MRMTVLKTPPRRQGSTLLELSIVVTMTGILSAMAIPSFQRSIEQARVDQAAATLRTIWAAERFYKLDHTAYADDHNDPDPEQHPPRPALKLLLDAGLLDVNIDSSAFHFSIADGGFPVQAEQWLDCMVRIARDRPARRHHRSGRRRRVRDQAHSPVR